MLRMFWVMQFPSVQNPGRILCDMNVFTATADESRAVQEATQ